MFRAAKSNPLHGEPSARALIVALESWLRDGVLPPADRFPNLLDGTLIAADQAAAKLVADRLMLEADAAMLVTLA